MIAMWQAQLWVPPVTHHAEGPLWDADTETVYWVDQLAGLVRSARQGETAAELMPPIEVPAPVGACVPHAEGGFMLAAGRGFARMDASGAITELAPVLGDDNVRWNDGKVDPHGRFWAGTMAADETPGAGALYLLEHDQVRVMRTGVTISNGLAWSPSGAIMYYIDTPTQQVQRFRVDGELIPDGIAANVENGFPDGMCIDDEGMLWVALWGSGAVERFTPDGELIGRIEVDAPQASSCCFGGPDRDILFITTSREGYTPAQVREFPLAGGIFAAQLGVTGPLTDAYRS